MSISSSRLLSDLEFLNVRLNDAKKLCLVAQLGCVKTLSKLDFFPPPPPTSPNPPPPGLTPVSGAWTGAQGGKTAQTMVANLETRVAEPHPKTHGVLTRI